MSNQAPGLNEYEKSVFLTKAQNEVLKNYFNPKGNKYQEGFDGNEKRQIDFSNIIKVNAMSVADPSTAVSKIDSRSVLYRLPPDVLFILNEIVIVNKNKTLVVVPVNYTEYTRLMSKPYKYPIKTQAWRLLQTNVMGGVETLCEIIANGTINSYTMRYVKKPNPIILENLTGTGLTIEGVSVNTECELDSILHPEVLQRAVELAKAAYTGDVKSMVELGQRSE